MTRLNLLAAIVASVLSFVIFPAHSAEIASQGDTARFLAGMPPSADSPLVALTKNASWQEHAKAMDRAFAVVEKTTLSKVRDWSAEHLKSPQKTLLYMFSGPDYLYANAFFPDATTYIMAGLEPAGEIPDLVKMQRRGGIAGLGNLQHSMRTLLAVSFFITHEMQSNLRESGLRGTIPILYVFLARSDKQVLDTSLVYIDDDGALQPENPKAKSSAHGVKIVFAGKDGAEKTLYYFTTNLANDGVKRGGFLKFCRKARALRRLSQERVLSDAQQRVLTHPRVHPRQEYDDCAGRQRHSVPRVRRKNLAIAAVRPLSDADADFWLGPAAEGA